MSEFLGLRGSTYLITGFANRKSVAWHIGEILEKEGSNLIYTVRTKERKNELLLLKPDAKIIVCDFENAEQINHLKKNISKIDK